MSSGLTPTLTHDTQSPRTASASAARPFGEAPAVGERLGRYVVLRRLGEGAMGVVYSAFDELLARRVALKLVRADVGGNAASGRMFREAKALARLSHPNVVGLYEVSAAAGHIFLAMEHVEGDTLRAWTAARRQGADLREILDMLVQAGRGLAAAHAAGLVHRDFKPDNVLVGVDGRARVADFGLVADSGWSASRPDDAGAGAVRVEFTAGGGLLGTPAYMSPEQFAGRPTDARSDQFSYCVVVYEAVCGVRPFVGEGVEELRAAVADGRLRPPPPTLPAWLWALLRRGLATDPADRFASMDALLAGLARDPAAIRRRRRQIAALAGASVALAVAAALLIQSLQQRWQRHARELAAARGLDVLEARVAAARDAGDTAAAERLFAAYVEDPQRDGTEAVARAWLGEAARRAGDGSRDGVGAALATAYLAAASPALQADALVGLVRHFHAGLELDGLAQTFAHLERTHPDRARAKELAGLRAEAALARRDLAAARQADVDSPARRLAAALVGATPTAHVDIDGISVNASHVLLLDMPASGRRFHLARRDQALTPVRSDPLPPGTTTVRVVATDPFHAVVHDDARGNTLLRVDEDGVTPVAELPGGGPLALAAADLAGDGTRALYIGSGAATGIKSLVQDGRGAWTWETVYSDVEALRSSVHGLLARDLDGDGREELIAGLNGWHAFDVRVLQRVPGSTRLRSVARDKLGETYGLAAVRVGGAPLLVANHFQGEGSTLVFPPDRPRGDPEGLYLYAFDGARLARRGRLALPAGEHWNLWAADLDGDGREDLAVRGAEYGLQHTVVELQGEDGSFTPVPIGRLRFLAAAQLDDDAPRELLGEIEADEGSHRVWVVGAGADDLPAVAAPASAVAALADPDDPTWTRQAGDAAALADMGLLVDAAEALRGLGRRAARGDLRGGAFLRAAALYERGQRYREAVELYRAAAAVPEVAAAAYPGLLRAELRVGDYDEAGETLADLERAPGLDADTRAALTRDHGGLARGIVERIDVDLRAPLAPAWDLGDARALRRDPDGLVIETLAPGVLLSLPLTVSGELFELDVDVSLRQFEWSTHLEIGLVAGDDPRGDMPVRVQAHASGTSRGGFLVTRHFSCAIREQRLVAEDMDRGLANGDEPVRVGLRVALTAGLAEAGCEIRSHRAARSRHRRVRDAPRLPAGAYRLVVRSSNDAPAWLDATLHSVSLRGATLRPVATADPQRAALARAVLARDAVATVAAAAGLAGPTPRERAWLADALLQLGRRDEADAVWSGLLAAAALEPSLATRLRGDPAVYGPHLHALDPAGQPARLAAVWRNTAVNHLGDPAARRALAAALAAVDADVALAAARDDGDRGAIVDLLGWRGRLWARAGDPTRARADFERALTIVAALAPDAAQAGGAWQLWLELATLAAAADDRDGAAAAVARARRSSDMPDVVDDVVRARPTLAALVE